jgi:hypothetical protein
VRIGVRARADRRQLPTPGIPLPRVIHRHERFTLTPAVCPDPERDVLLLDIQLDGDATLRPYVLRSPRLGGGGHDNQAWARRRPKRRSATDLSELKLTKEAKGAK